MAIWRRCRASPRWPSAMMPGCWSDDAHGLGVVGGGRGARRGDRRAGRLADGHAVEGGRLLWRLSLRLAAGDRADGEPRAHARLFDRPAAGHRGGGDRRARHHRARPRTRRLPLAKARAFTRGGGLAAGDQRHRAGPAGRREAALAAARLLETEGFLVAAIRPPTVPAGTARLRVAFTAAHPDAALARLAGLIRDRILAFRATA